MSTQKAYNWKNEFLWYFIKAFSWLDGYRFMDIGRN